MSLIPMLFSNWWEELDHPHRIFDQDFGLGLYPDQLQLEPQRLDYLYRNCPMYRNLYYRPPWASLLNDEKGTSTVKADKDKFEVILDVQQFKPEEIDVKVVDNYVVVNGKHEEKRDEHGWISREFTRKYLIPEQCNIEAVSSKLSSDGILSITAPRKEEPKLTNEKVISIEHTGQPALKTSMVPKENDNKTA